MKLIKNNDLRLSFPYITGRCVGLLLLMVLSVNSFAQIHVADNTVFKVAENTILYVAGDTSGINIQNETPSQKNKKIAKRQKKSKAPSQPPMVKKDIEPGNRHGVLTFTSKQKRSSALFYADKTARVALVNNISVAGKSLPAKKEHYHNIHPFLLNSKNQRINTTSGNLWLPSKKHSEENITRPPPFQV